MDKNIAKFRRNLKPFLDNDNEIENLNKGVNKIEINKNNPKLRRNLKRFLSPPNDNEIENLNKCFKKIEIKKESPIQIPSKKRRINPYTELNNKIKNLGDNPSLNELQNLKSCYTFRCWVWKNHNMTWEEFWKPKEKEDGEKVY